MFPERDCPSAAGHGVRTLNLKTFNFEACFVLELEDRLHEEELKLINICGGYDVAG